jgi:hypothetical protein
MKNSFYFLLALFGFGLILISCQDDEPEAVTVDPTMQLQMRVGNETLTAGNIYEINGTALQVNVAQFYVGEVTLSGDETNASEDFFVMGTNLNSISLPNSEVGDYDFSSCRRSIRHARTIHALELERRI